MCGKIGVSRIAMGGLERIGDGDVQEAVILYYRSWIERMRGFIRWRFGLRTGAALHDLFGSLIDRDPLVLFGTLLVLWGLIWMTENGFCSPCFVLCCVFNLQVN